MSAKTPIRTVFDGSNNATGLAEFQSGEFIALTHGGLGASLSIGSAGQVLKVNSGASALEFGNVEAVLNIDGMTDGTSITIVDGDLLAISDGGTEKRVTASQLKTYIGGYDGTIGTLDIDGGTDIGAALADADLIIVDDGAGGTNRKAAMSRVATYIQSGISGDITISGGTAAIGSGVIVNADINASAAIADSKLATISTAGKVDIGALEIDGATDIGAAIADADLFIIDDGAGGTNRKTAASRIKTYVADVTLTTAAQTNITSVGTLSSLTVDNIVINGTNIGHTSDTDALNIDSSGNVTASQNLTVTGDLTVNGSTTTVNSTNTTIDDNLLELNSGASSNSNDSGIIIERGSTGDNAVLMWDESADQFVVGTTTATASSTGNISHTKADLQAATITGSAGVFTSTGISSVMTVTGTDDGAGEGPDIVIKRNSASPADDDILGALVFKGENDADEAVTYGKIRSRATDVSDGTEDGKLELFTMKAGTSTMAASLDNTSLFLNTGVSLVFEGGTANAHETTLGVVDPDGDRTINLPNQSGTLPVLAAASTTQISSTPEELNLLDGSSAGTIVNSKAVVYGSSGEVNATTLQIAGTSITSTATELNLLDGVSGLVQADFTKLAAVDATATELNIVDGDTSAGTTAVAGSDGIVTNDAGTMRQTTVDTFDTYLSATTKTLTNKTLTSPQVNTQVDMLARAELRFQDAAGGQYVALEAPATVASNVTFTLPSADGTDGQAIVTDGSGALSFADAGSSGFSDSTITTLPGSEGDFDLAKTNNSGSAETGLTSGATDSFGVATGAVFTLMEPVGASTSNNTDLGDSESHVGA